MNDDLTSHGLLFDVRKSVAWLTLNRPTAMNVTDLEMIHLFESSIPRAISDDNISAIVLTGQGGAFCAGADLKSGKGENPLAVNEEDFTDRLNEGIFSPLRRCPKPIVAALNGLTLAGGWNWRFVQI